MVVPSNKNLAPSTARFQGAEGSSCAGAEKTNLDSRGSWSFLSDGYTGREERSVGAATKLTETREG